MNKLDKIEKLLKSDDLASAITLMEDICKTNRLSTVEIILFSGELSRIKKNIQLGLIDSKGVEIANLRFNVVSRFLEIKNEIEKIEDHENQVDVKHDIDNHVNTSNISLRTFDPQKKNKVFLENFENNNSGWKINASCLVQDNRYLITSSNLTLIKVPNLTSENYSIDVEVGLKKSWNKKKMKWLTNGIFSIIWNRKDDDPYSGNSISLFLNKKVRIGTYLPNINLLNQDVFDCNYIVIGSWNYDAGNSIRIVKEQDQYTFYINGREIRKMNKLSNEGNLFGFETKGIFEASINKIEIK